MPGPIDDIRNRADQIRARSFNQDGMAILDPELDLRWSMPEGTKRSPHTYFDYVFTGEDVTAYIEGAPKEECLPIVALGFSIEQVKTPVYGFWSYTFDAVMRGTRLINGMISIATVSTNFMRDQISHAATERSRAKGNLSPIRGLDRDEKNIQEYWSRNIDSSAMFNEKGKSIFSAHPPFNLCIDFNMQSVSLGDSPFDIANDLGKQYNDGPVNFQNYNERLVNINDFVPEEMSYILENVELMEMSTQFSASSGDPIGETYTFIARDLRTPRDWGGLNA